jgi:hypothetical protein
MNLAVALWQTGDRAGAESILREGIALNPAYAPARELLARIPKRRSGCGGHESGVKCAWLAVNKADQLLLNQVLAW